MLNADTEFFTAFVDGASAMVANTRVCPFSVMSCVRPSISSNVVAVVVSEATVSYIDGIW